MAESLFIRADEVIRLLGVSKSEAYNQKIFPDFGALLTVCSYIETQLVVP